MPGARIVHLIAPEHARPKLRDLVRAGCRLQQKSCATEKAYWHWIKKFIVFSGLRSPRELGPDDVRAFLTYLAAERRVTFSTQNQALNALVWLYKFIVKNPLPFISGIERARRPSKMPVVLTHSEVDRIFSELSGVPLLACQMLYGSGLRLIEAIRLRVKDVDFEQGQIAVRAGKGNKDRLTILPEAVKDTLMAHLQRVRRQHLSDLETGYGEAPMPNALAQKYPGKGFEFGWQYCFPSSAISVNRETGRPMRHHMSEKTVQRAFNEARRRASVLKHAGPHTLRHCFASHLWDARYDLHTIQGLLGHSDVKTTMIYLHALNKGGPSVVSPLDHGNS